MKSLLAGLLLLGLITNANAEQITRTYGNSTVYTGNSTGISLTGSGVGFSESLSEWSTIRGHEYASSRLWNDYAAGIDPQSGSGGGFADTLVSFNVSARSLSSSTPLPTYIPITIDWTLAVSTNLDLSGRSTGSITAIAVAGFSGNLLNGPITRRVEASGVGVNIQTNTGSESVLLDSAGFLDVYLSASTIGGISCFQSSCSSFGYAFADPIITIDPNWAYASLFTLDYSIPEIAYDSYSLESGTRPVSSVPESSSIYLLAFGLLGLFGAARRKV